MKWLQSHESGPLIKYGQKQLEQHVHIFQGNRKFKKKIAVFHFTKQ